ncbi:D-isomer specific 2-hydroxyacid dehydrogenase family protein [Rhizobacter sp. Root1221]|uniref:NAD(P)-dependent oxidoreductase n=1 Tax=Rhizobacter sp. Root1221 TaxID=1736433 RepID=UPI0006F74CAC|nr:NAD(P)-dependent oxidoreductase [Rhizobacter sp. Root1221]KQV95736.1 phosphoglycerate dehydrogenase [Rhizobacter sp. Root1221]
MDLLIVDTLDAEVTQWLESRHSVRYAPELALDSREFRSALYNVRAVILPSSVPFGAKTLPFAPLMRAVGRVNGGAENIDADACMRAGIEVVRSATATAQAEAEFMIGALLSMLRRVPIAGTDGMLVGRELGAATVGLIGMPPAARAMASMLGGFGCRVIGYEPSLHASDGVWDRWKVAPMPLRELIETSDALAVQLSYFTRYQGLLGERLLPYCKPHQVMVSVSHSGVFDERSLADVLASGRMAAAWLDSLEPGALDEGRPLHGAGNLQITPRLGSTTRESRLRSAWAVARRIDELLMATPVAPNEFRPTSPGEPLDLAAEPESP